MTLIKRIRKTDLKTQICVDPSYLRNLRLTTLTYQVQILATLLRRDVCVERT